MKFDLSTADSKVITGHSTPARFRPRRKRGQGARSKHAPDDARAGLENFGLTPALDIESAGPKEAKRPAPTHAIGRVRLSQSKSHFTHQPGNAYTSEEIEMCNRILADCGEEALRLFLNNGATKGEDMPNGQDLRTALLNGFSAPEFLSVVLERPEFKGVNYATAYAALKKLVEDGLLIQAETALHPVTKNVKPKFVNPAARGKLSASTSNHSTESGSVSSQQHKRTMALVGHSKSRHQVGDQPLISITPTSEDDESGICQLCKTLGHRVSDFHLGLRELSQSERVAMVRLARMISENVGELAVTGLEPSSVVSDGQRVADPAQQGKAADANWQQSA